jgi:ABC-type transport system substrate-binding protein
MYAQEEPIDEGQEGMMPEEYQNGGGYSGTYDAGSGSYFQGGGSFVPTYGDILPQYMYGSDYMQEGGSTMGYNVGDTLEVSPEEMEYLRQQGYDFDTI